MISQKAQQLKDQMRQERRKDSLDSGALQYPIPSADLLDGLDFEVTQLQDCQITTIFSPSSRQGVILFLHGGAYLRSFGGMHWRFAAKLVKATGYHLVAPDYPILPKGNFLAAHQLLQALYHQLLQDYPGEEIFIVGDSAGAGLGLGLTMELRDLKQPLPKKLLLLSPYLDVTMTNPEIPAKNQEDPWLNPDSLRESGLRYAAGNDPKDFRLSPIYGAVHGLPPMMIVFGTSDVLYPDGQKFRAICAQQQISLQFFEEAGLFHVYPLFELPEAEKIWPHLVAFLQG